MANKLKSLPIQQGTSDVTLASDLRGKRPTPSLKCVRTCVRVSTAYVTYYRYSATVRSTAVDYGRLRYGTMVLQYHTERRPPKTRGPQASIVNFFMILESHCIFLAFVR